MIDKIKHYFTVITSFLRNVIDKLLNLISKRPKRPDDKRSYDE